MDGTELQDIIRRLDQLGLPTAAIAHATHQSEGTVTATLSYSSPSPVSERDKEIANRFQDLQQLAMKEAERILLFGPSEQKLAIVRSVLSTTGRNAKDPGVNTGSVKLEFERLMADIRDVPSSPVSQPPLTFGDHAEAEAVTQRTYDQDQIPRDA